MIHIFYIIDTVKNYGIIIEDPPPYPFLKITFRFNSTLILKYKATLLHHYTLL